MGSKKVIVPLFLILITNEQVWSDTVPHFYNFSESTGWYNYEGGNWKFTYNNDYPDAQHPHIDSDAGYTFSQDGARSGYSGLASPIIYGVVNEAVFAFSLWSTRGIDIYTTTDNFKTLLFIGRHSGYSNVDWSNDTIYCFLTRCCDFHPCDVQILMLNSDGDSSHPAVSELQWFLVDDRPTTIPMTYTTITTTPSTTETTNSKTETTSTTKRTSSTTVITTESSATPSTDVVTTPDTTSPSETSTPFTTTIPPVITVMYNFSSCTTGWFNYGDGDWQFTCMDNYPDGLHPQIDSDVGYTFSQDGLDIPMVGLESPIISGVNAETIFTFSYWFSLATAFPGSVGIEFYSSIDNFGTIQPMGNFLSSNEWAIGSIDCKIVQCCADYPCDLKIMVLNAKGDVDHPTVAALQWFSIGSKSSN